MKTIKSVNNYCSNKVLPLVYDDSLSYYEVLCKLTDKMNEIINVLDNSLEDFFLAHINEIMIHSLYDEANETIKLLNAISTDGDLHIYNAENKTMEII